MRQYLHGGRESVIVGTVEGGMKLGRVYAPFIVLVARVYDIVSIPLHACAGGGFAQRENKAYLRGVGRHFATGSLFRGASASKRQEQREHQGMFEKSSHGECFCYGSAGHSVPFGGGERSHSSPTSLSTTLQELMMTLDDIQLPSLSRKNVRLYSSCRSRYSWSPICRL